MIGITIKKSLSIGVVFLLNLNLSAQTIPNAGFENWTTKLSGMKEPDNWNVLNFSTPPVVSQSTEAAEGNYSVKLICKEVTIEGEKSSDCGVASTEFSIAEKPTSFYFYYKYKSQNNIGSAVYVDLTNSSLPANQQLVGTTTRSISDLSSITGDDFIQTKINFTYFNNNILPDKANILIINYKDVNSEKDINNIGNELWIDALSFTPQVFVDFTADKTTANVNEKINLRRTIQHWFTATYKWTFTPNNVTYLEGTSENSYNPIVSFNKAGTYTAKLEVTLEGQTGFKEKTSYITIEEPSAISNLSSSVQNLKLYPNPANDIINVSFNLPSNADVKISLSNLAGVAIKELLNTSLTSGAQNLKFNISDLQAGLYFMNIYADSKLVSTSKIVKQ